MMNLKKSISPLSGWTLSACLLIALGSCEETSDIVKDDNVEIPETPFSDIPDKFVGTWYAENNASPLSINWENGSFQGEQGFAEFRTLVFTKDGKNAIEYTSEVMNVLDEEKKYAYKITGTVAYEAVPGKLTFYARKGTMRIFSNQHGGYEEYDISQTDIEDYKTVLLNPEATTYSSSTNYLTARRLDGSMELSARYIKADGASGPVDPNDLYSKPPTSGTYVQIGEQYYPTVTIADKEWMSVNYAGPGGITSSGHPEYGTFYRHTDLSQLPIPSGWRIPSRQDYLDLLASQNIEFDTIWDSTDGADLESKKLLGQLMSTTGWLKQDGYANNQSGFNAVPANLQVTNGSPQGEGSNCLLWTSQIDEEGNPVAFKIIQLPSDTYASFSGYVSGFNPPHIPVRFVRDK